MDLFAPAAALTSGKIRLFNGQIVCTSCHDLKRPAKGHLVIDNDNSRLCLICHRK